MFQKLVTINSAPTPANYAHITLQDGRCPFLSDRLCTIQQHLGEEHLSHTCATFPRSIHEVSGIIERSLDLSCPEAARLALTNPQPMEFRLSGQTPQPPDYFSEARGLVIGILQNRRHPLSTRLLLLAQLCDLLTETSQASSDILQRFRNRIESGSARDQLPPPAFNHSAQLKLVLELINARVRIDFVSPRYLQLFQEFAAGIHLESTSDWNLLTARYARAARDYYLPFMHHHEYMLENYLVAYAFKTALPSAASHRHPAPSYLLMASYFAIAQALMIGLSAKYQADFGSEHVVHCIQSTSKALEHCLTYPSRVLQILAGKGITTAAQMALVIAT